MTTIDGIKVKNDAEFGKQYVMIKQRPNKQFTLTLSILPRQSNY